MKSVVVYSDYVCPFCLLAEKVVSRATAGRNIGLSWRAFELRPAPVPTLKPEDPYLPSIWARSVYPLAEQLGVPIKLPSISPQPRTAKAFELLAMAQDQGRDHAYSLRVLQAFFQEDRNIGDPQVLVGLAADVGIDAEAARLALKDGTYRARHREALRHAKEDMGIRSVPTIVVGDQIFRGTPPMAQLEAALDQFEAAAGPKQSHPLISIGE